jgi:hypothetical protein
MVYSFARIGVGLGMIVEDTHGRARVRRTAKLYDRRGDEIMLDEVERITI